MQTRQLLDVLNIAITPSDLQYWRDLMHDPGFFPVHLILLVPCLDSIQLDHGLFALVLIDTYPLNPDNFGQYHLRRTL